jgi:uncharacterized damage-inducible protein DinB
MTDFADYFDRVRERTMRVAACIPPDKLEWTYKQGKYTLGDILRHLAGTERWMFTENAQQRPSRYPGHGRELADGHDATLEYVHRLHDQSMAILRTLTDADLEKKCMTPGGAELRVGKWLRLMAEHEIHHRGQIYVYLGILGIETPPIYGLTEEQVKERSVPLT